MRKFKEDDKGMTLVELIVVVGIISVMLTAVFLGTGLATSKEASGCAGKIATTLQNSRLTAMGKADGAVNTVIRRDATGNVVIVETVSGTEVSNTVIGKPRLSVKYRVGAGALQELPEGGSIVISFDRSTGGLKKTAEGGSQYYTAIEISGGGRVSTVTLVPLTGRISVD